MFRKGGEGMEKRKFRRFVAPFKMEIKQADGKASALGIVKDFSRSGIRAVFDRFDCHIGSAVNFRIEKRAKNIAVSARGIVVWKRFAGGKWDAGIKFIDFPPEAKADILEDAYKSWLGGLLKG